MSPKWTMADLLAYENRRNKMQNENAEPKPTVCNDPLGSDAVEANYPNRCKISITSYRVRLCDPDNITEKFFIDALRYCGVITDDTEKHIMIEKKQIKASCIQRECTVIRIEFPD